MTDIASRIREISEGAARNILGSSIQTVAWSSDYVEVAIYEAIEAVLAMEASDNIVAEAIRTTGEQLDFFSIHRAMTAALLEEIRKERK